MRINVEQRRKGQINASEREVAKGGFILRLISRLLHMSMEKEASRISQWHDAAARWMLAKLVFGVPRCAPFSAD